MLCSLQRIRAMYKNDSTKDRPTTPDCSGDEHAQRKLSYGSQGDELVRDNSRELPFLSRVSFIQTCVALVLLSELVRESYFCQETQKKRTFRLLTSLVLEYVADRRGLIQYRHKNNVHAHCISRSTN